MSSSNSIDNQNTSNGTNGSIVLKSFSELASALDLKSLPAGPSDAAETDEPGVSIDSTDNQEAAQIVPELPPIKPAAVDLATVIAQLASVSTDLESMARQDARARERATIELAQYETLIAD